MTRLEKLKSSEAALKREVAKQGHLITKKEAAIICHFNCSGDKMAAGISLARWKEKYWQ